MWRSASVRSFSLIEMLVVLVLSSIIVSIVYFSYETIAKYQLSYRSKLDRFNDVSDVYFLLKEDFDRCKTILATDSEHLKFHIEKRGIDVEYYFGTSYVLRTQSERSDTFRCETSDPVFLWQGKKIENDQGRMDELQLDIESMAEPVHLVMRKDYDASSLIETVKQDTTSERN